MMEHLEYGRERSKDIVEKEEEGPKKPAAAKEEVKEQQQEPGAAKEQQQDDERYDTVSNIKLVYEGKQVKEFRVTGNLNKSNTKMIIVNSTPHNE